MLKILLFCCALAVANGHNNHLVNDGDMQSALMPQELNPVFVPDDEKPWRSELPLPRIRRDLDLETPKSTTTMQQVKTYSRIVAGVVLALATVVEIIVYVVEIYYT